MSAYKTAYIRLGESEYKKLRAAEEQLRLNNLLQAESKNGRQKEEQSIYENMMGIKRQNDQNFQNLVVDLEGEIRRIEYEASTWVENQANKMQNDLHDYRADIQKQASERLEELAFQADQQMLIKENEYNAYWLAQEERIAAIENRWEAYQNLALDWIQKDQGILDFIYMTYSIDANNANVLEMQRQYLNQVIQQYNNGFFDIAASAGFQIFTALSNLRFQQEVHRSLQAIQYQNLQRKVDELAASLLASQSVHAMDGDGNELTDMIDVDFWVEGKLNECSAEVNLVIAKIQQDDSIDLNKISDYVREVEELSSRLLDLVTQARVIVLASQLRFNVALIVVQSLEAQGFFLEQAKYEKDDYRESFIARTCNYAGNEVVVSIDPDPGLDEGGEIHIHSLDADQITQYELRERNFEIFNAIQENGIEVNDIKEVNPDAYINKIDQSHLNKLQSGHLNLLEEKLNHGRH